MLRERGRLPASPLPAMLWIHVVMMLNAPPSCRYEEGLSGQTVKDARGKTVQNHRASAIGVPPHVQLCLGAAAAAGAAVAWL